MGWWGIGRVARHQDGKAVSLGTNLTAIHLAMLHNLVIHSLSSINKYHKYELLDKLGQTT